MEKKHLYRVIFINQGKVYEIYAKKVQQGELYGFVEVEELIFNTKSSVVVDPSEERLKSEFDGVKMSIIPMHAIIRIDLVDKQGIGKIINLGEETSNVTPFPVTPYSIGKGPGKT